MFLESGIVCRGFHAEEKDRTHLSHCISVLLQLWRRSGYHSNLSLRTDIDPGREIFYWNSLQSMPCKISRNCTHNFLSLISFYFTLKREWNCKSTSLLKGLLNSRRQIISRWLSQTSFKEGGQVTSIYQLHLLSYWITFKFRNEGRRSLMIFASYRPRFISEWDWIPPICQCLLNLLRDTSLQKSEFMNQPLNYVYIFLSFHSLAWTVPFRTGKPLHFVSRKYSLYLFVFPSPV